MHAIYDFNGLVFWTEREIRLRNRFTEHLAAEVERALLATNPSWRMIRVEAPLLTPRSLISSNYNNEDIWAQERLNPTDTELVLRPETTPGSYVYARHMLDNHTGVKAPLCIWQSGLSFRREQDQTLKHMRLKQFHQLEFQAIYTVDTLNDYHTALLEPVRHAIAELIALPSRIAPSDRLPTYSEVTSDVEIDNGDKWMEVASISRRVDFPGTVLLTTRKGVLERELRVIEIAIGLDRLVYNYECRVTTL
jgi:glycyl-tRNA synthetase